MSLDICIFGYGLMGRTHMEMYDSNQNVRSITIVDPYLTLPNRIVPKKNIRFVKFLDDKELFDIVSICTPSAYHFQIFKRYAKQAKAFLIEKPPTLSLEESQRIKEMSDGLSMIVGCAFVERFNPAIESFKERTYYIRKNGHYSFKRITPVPDPSLWYYNEKLSGGPLLDLGIHDFDLARWIVGENYSKISVEGEEKIECKLIFPSGLTAEIITGWLNRGDKFTNEISYKEKNFNIVLNTNDLERERYPYAYKKEIDYFIDRVLGKDNGFPLIDDGIKILELIDLIKKMLRNK